MKGVSYLKEKWNVGTSLKQLVTSPVQIRRRPLQLWKRNRQRFDVIAAFIWP